jgi:hypothetical protein
MTGAEKATKVRNNVWVLAGLEDVHLNHDICQVLPRFQENHLDGCQHSVLIDFGLGWDQIMHSF